MKCSNISRIRIIFYAMLLILFSIGIAGCSGDTQQTAGYSSGDGGDSGWIRKQAKALENDQQITTNTDDQAQPSVAYDTANNRYLVVWTDYRDVNSSCAGPLCGTDIYGVTCTGSGTGTGTTMTCGTEFVISNAAGHQSQPKVAFDIENSKYLVIWTDSRNSGYSRIYGQYVNTDGTLNGANTPLTPHEDPALLNPYDTAVMGLLLRYTSQSEPAIIYNETLGRFILTWRDVSNSDSAHSVVLSGAGCNNSISIDYIPIPSCNSVDYSLIRTGEINGANPLTNASNIQDYSSLVFTDGFRDTGSSITASFETQVDETYPAPFYDKTNGNYFAVWQGRTYDVEFIMPYTTEAVVGTETQYVSPAVFGDGDGTWEAGESFTVTSGSPITGIAVFLPNGDSVTGITTTGLGSTSVTITLQSASNAVGTTGNLRADKTLDLGNTCIYKTATWTATDSDGGLQKIKVRRWETMGATRLARDLSYPCGANANNSYNPSVSTDPNTKRALIVWEEQECADKQIYGRLIDLTNFSNYSAQINVSTAQGDQTLPQVSYDNVNQRFMVVWEDARNQNVNISNMDIYGQFIDPQGNLSGSNLPVTVASGNQMEPALVFGDVDFRKFFIVWKDGRAPDNLDIYGQLWEYSVAPALLITYENDNPIYSQAIDFGNVDVGSSATKRFRLWNNGNAILTVNSITDPYEPFTLPTAKPTTIAPGVYYEMEVKFAPTAAGSYAGSPSNNYKIDVSSDGGSVALYLSGSSSNIEPLTITTASLPDAGIGTAYSQTLSAYGGTIPYTWSVAGSLPPGLSLNSGTGVISGTPITAGSYTFTAQVTDKNGTTATRSLTIRVSVVNITTTGLKPWTINISGYSETLSAAGGTPAYTWSISSGNLPSGLTLAATGIISGTPSSAGSYTFTAKVVDTASSEATKEFTIVINPSPVVLTTSLPSTVIGSSYSAIITVAGGTSPLTWSIISGSLPPGILLNTGSGQLSGTPTAAGSYTFTVQVTDAPGASVTKEFTLIVTNPLSITTATLPDGTFGGTYTTTLTADGGKIPYTWSITQGSLPTGVTLAAATGIISGTLSAAGTFSFTVQVTDADGRTAAKTYSIVVYSPLTITTTGLKPWTKDRAGYSETLSATGGKTAYTWSVSAGSLPNGLSLAPATGVISGTPTIAGSYPFTIMATDANSATSTRSFTIVINPVLSITTASLANGTVGAGYSQQVVISGGTSPCTWSLSLGTLPLGLTLDTATGVISGTPTTAATSTFTVQVTDAPGASVTKSLSIEIVSPLSINTATLSDATSGASYSQTLSATGGKTPYTWSVTGSLPTGVTLAAATGIISGTPSATGTFSFIIQVADADGRTAAKTLSIVVYNPLTITTTGLKPWTKDRAGYSETLAATGGKTAYTWSVSAGSLPNGLSLAPATGVISGTPTIAGSYPFTIMATDANSATSTKDFTIVINPVLSITTASLANGTVGAGYSQQVVISGGTSPCTWSLSLGTLPLGLTLDTATGVISGTPTTAATSTFTVQVTDAPGASVTKSYSIIIYAAPDISIAPTTFAFGSVGIGIVKDITVTVSNTGGSPLIISALSVEGTGFSLVGSPSIPHTISSETSAIFAVRFTPSLRGTYSGKLTVISNDPDSGTLTYALTGNGVNPPDIDVTPGAVDFGTLLVGVAKRVTLTIRNNATTGDGDLVINEFAIEGIGFSFVTPPAYPQTLAPGASTTVTIEFTSPSAGAFNGSLKIKSNDPDEATVAVSLKAAVQPPPDITVSPVALSFGNVPIGQAKDLILSINNTGESDLSITDITVSGTGFSFAAAPSLPLTIAKGGSSSVTVRFAPAAVLSYSGTLTITSNDPDSPTLQVDLTGAGVNQPEIDVSPASLDFGNVQIDTTSDKKITIKNTGTANLNITASISGSGFTFSASPPTQVVPGGSVDITVRFSPVAEANYTGSLVIQSNDADESNVTVSLSGTGSTQPSGGGGGGGGSISSGGGGGGCSIGGHQNAPSAFADMAVMLMPLFVIIMLRIRRKKK